MSEVKKYADYSLEEKQAYKMKRNAYLERRADETKKALEALTIVCQKDEACKNALNAYIATLSKSGSSSHETYLTKLFGTEDVKAGEVYTFKYISIRGPNNERINDDESVKDFVMRTGDVTYKYDTASINQACWYINRKNDHQVVCDKINGRVKIIR